MHYTHSLTVLLVLTHGVDLLSGGNVCLLFIWKSESGPWMQALHLFFGLGAILGPVIAGPFLVETGDVHSLDNTNTTEELLTTTEDMVNSTSGSNITDSMNLTHFKEESYISIPYGVIGVGEVLIGLCFLVIFVRDGLHVRARKEPKEKDESAHSEETLRKLKYMRNAIIIVIFIFYSLYCTVESEMGNFLVLFCVNFLGWSKQQSAWLNAAFWTSFTISRGCGIFLVKVLKPHTMIFGDIIIAFIGMFPLLFWVDSHPAVIWVCFIVTGAGIATIFATGITWTDRYIKVTEAVGSVFMIGGALSDMYGPISDRVPHGKSGLYVVHLLHLCCHSHITSDNGCTSANGK